MEPDNDPFTAEEVAALAALAVAIIPASERYGLPGADDPAILATILADAARHRSALAEPLTAFDGNAETFRQTHPTVARLLQTLVAQAYYRDDRVMRSLAIETRPPFPRGYEVEQGDWSLLDPVRARPPLYRATD